MGTGQLRISSSRSESRNQASKLAHLRYLLQSRETAKHGRMYRKGSRTCLQRLRCLLKSTMGSLREKLQIQQGWEGTFASWLAKRSSDWHTHNFTFPFLMLLLWVSCEASRERKPSKPLVSGSKLCRTVCVRYVSSDRLHDTSHLRKEDFIVLACSGDGMAEYVVRALPHGEELEARPGGHPSKACS